MWADGGSWSFPGSGKKIPKMIVYPIAPTASAVKIAIKP
jgi:hypothetical protein